MKAAAMNELWHVSLGGEVSERTGMAGLGRRLRHVFGATRRRMEAELAELLKQIDSVRDLDESALSEALAAIRVEARLGRLNSTRNSAARTQLLHALALLAAAAERNLHWRPYPRQLLAALAMHEGLLVEMPAGEGKTLAVALAAILHAWRGHPCHVATGNEYLAQRDAELMRPLYVRCGLEVAAIAQSSQPDLTTEAYRADVVYAAGRQLLTDFLRDQIILGGVDDVLRMRVRDMKSDSRQPVMRGLYAVIVDDAESVLFDDATTPVVISAPSDNPMLIEAVRGAHQLVAYLTAERDYRYLAGKRDIEFTADGESLLDQHGGLMPPLWRVAERRDDLVRQAIVVRDQLHAQRHYVIQQGRLSIIDDYIGRLLARPAWTHGLHQAIELKEGLQPSPQARVLARMAMAPFFRRYRHLGGIGVDIREVSSEAWRSLGRLTLRLPASETGSHPGAMPYLCRPSIWLDQAAKRAAFIESLFRLHRSGLPALVSLRRVSDAESIARQLAERGVKCQFISTRQSTGVAEMLNRAAQPGQITLTLNMEAGGIDLPLALSSGDGENFAGSVKNTVEASAAVDLAGAEFAELAHNRGLRILQFEAQELARQDRRILHLTGRRGYPGVARQYLALDDDVLRHYLPACCRHLHAWVAQNAPASLSRISVWLLRYAQRRARNQARRQRLMQPRREALLNQQLAFAGDRDMDVGVQQFGKHRKD